MLVGVEAAPAQTSAVAQQVFFTKRVNDPNLVPVLLAHGVRFGAVKVPSLSYLRLHLHSCWAFKATDLVPAVRLELDSQVLFAASQPH